MLFHELAHFLKASLEQTGKVSKFCFDSRDVVPGSVFFALQGNKVDGHDFLEDVAKKGAALAIISKDYTKNTPLPSLQVPDVQQSIQDLAKAYLKTSHAQVIAITGSLGKTTTKGFVEQLLRQEFTVGATPRSCNSQIGLPTSILNMDLDVDKVVLEMGMSEPGNISRLVDIAPPDIAALIGVDFVHIGNFSGVEGVAYAKAEILKHPHTKMGFVFDQIPIRKEVLKVGSCKKLLFSMCDRSAKFFAEPSENGLIIYEDGKAHKILFKVPGGHNQKNLLAAVGICRLAGLSWKAIEKGSLHLSLPDRRLEIREKNKITFVNDTYNACLSSVKAALDALPKPKGKGKSYLVFGEMVDLGAYSHTSHEEVGKETMRKEISDVLCIGDECRVIQEVRKEKGLSTHLFTSKSEMESHLRKLLAPGDVVLFKGSNKHALWEIEKKLMEDQ